MTGSPGLEPFLAAPRAAGSVESGGVFTLDPRKANEKLAQIAYDGFYLIKLVQTAVASRARLVKVRLGDSWTDVGYFGKDMDEVPTEAVKKALNSPVR